MSNLARLNARAHDAKPALSFKTVSKMSGRAICKDHRYLHQCHPLHNLYLVQKAIHWRDRKTNQSLAMMSLTANHSKQHMAIRGLSLHQGIREIRKNLRQKLIFLIDEWKSHCPNQRKACVRTSVFCGQSLRRQVAHISPRFVVLTYYILDTYTCPKHVRKPSVTTGISVNY